MYNKVNVTLQSTASQVVLSPVLFGHKRANVATAPSLYNKLSNPSTTTDMYSLEEKMVGFSNRISLMFQGR